MASSESITLIVKQAERLWHQMPKGNLPTHTRFPSGDLRAFKELVTEQVDSRGESYLSRYRSGRWPVSTASEQLKVWLELKPLNADGELAKGHQSVESFDHTVRICWDDVGRWSLVAVANERAGSRRLKAVDITNPDGDTILLEPESAAHKPFSRLLFGVFWRLLGGFIVRKTPGQSQ